jgi:hypothetical protein
MKRGRKTTLSKPAVTAPRLAPTPPASLTNAERKLFLEIVSTHAHLKSGDAILLTAFVRAAIKFEQLGQQDDIAAWEKAGRMMLALARGLKLVSTTAARTLTRLREDYQPNLVAQWLRENPEPDDDDEIRRHTNGRN